MDTQTAAPTTAESATSLYGIAHFGTEGFAIFWRGHYDDTRYPSREAAIRELAKRDRAESFVREVAR